MKGHHSPQSTAANKHKRTSALPITAKARRGEAAEIGRPPTQVHLKDDGGIPRMAFKVAQAAQALGLDRGAVYDLVAAKKLRYVRCAGGTILIPVAALEEYLADDAS